MAVIVFELTGQLMHILPVMVSSLDLSPWAPNGMRLKRFVPSDCRPRGQHRVLVLPALNLRQHHHDQSAAVHSRCLALFARVRCPLLGFLCVLASTF